MIKVTSMKFHNLKCWPQFFQQIADDKKTFEMRQEDREEPFMVGDILTLHEYNQGEGEETGRWLRVEVVGILRHADFAAIPEGWCIMSLRPWPPQDGIRVMGEGV